MDKASCMFTARWTKGTQLPLRNLGLFLSAVDLFPSAIIGQADGTGWSVMAQGQLRKATGHGWLNLKELRYSLENLS